MILFLAAPLVLVELFTSQGCASCPPADALLEQLENDDVVVMSWHVDLWDGLGWRDPFADPGHTERQRAYARALGAEGIYTPQLVVSGRAEVVGNDRIRAIGAVVKAMKAPPTAMVAVAGERRGDGEVAVRWEPGGDLTAAGLVVAVVERDLGATIARGENAGLSVTHHNVVRGWGVFPATAGAAVLRVPGDLRVENTQVVAFVQDRATLAVRGVGRAPLQD